MSDKLLKVEELTEEAFSPYGTFAPVAPAKFMMDDGGPIRFDPACGGTLDLGPNANNRVDIGDCQVDWRPLVIDTVEYHANTEEGVRPLNGDIYLFVAIAEEGKPFDPATLKVFRVPKLFSVVIKKFIYHHAPFFAVEKDAVVDTQILLPRDTWKNDCHVEKLTEPIPFAP